MPAVGAAVPVHDRPGRVGDGAEWVGADATRAGVAGSGDVAEMVAADTAVDAEVAALTAAAERLAGADPAVWRGRDPRELMGVLRRLEAATRRLHAATSAVTAELVGREQDAGRTEASAAKHVAQALRVPSGAVRDRAAAGRRYPSPGMVALRAGRITAAQERCVARWVAELDHHTEVPDHARDHLARRLVALADGGASVTALRRHAEDALCALIPGRQDDREAAQARRREAVTHQVQPDGTSLLSVVCTPELRAVVDAVVARYAGRGRCLPQVVDPRTGLSVDPTREADPDRLADDDARSHAQRMHDALRHVLEIGLSAGSGAGTGSGRRGGVASIVIRLTPEQARQVFDGGAGGTVVTDAGTDLGARQAVAMSGPDNWFLSALHRGRELLTRLPIDGILDRGPGDDPLGGTRGPGPCPDDGPPPGPGPRPGPDPTRAPRASTAVGGNGKSPTADREFEEKPGPDGRKKIGDARGPEPGAVAAWRREVSSPARGAHTGRRDPRGPRIANALQRLVLYAAHGGCTHPGCDVPAARCQAHHLLEYRLGGRTVLVNLCLACPVHHGWVGDSPGSWRTRPDPGRPGGPTWIAPAVDRLREAA